MNKKFPEGFMWGASTSAYQVEGAYLDDGKLLSQQDILNKKEGFADTTVCSDHYHRYKEDVALMKEMGFSSYRFSISWPRIFPDGGTKINQKGVDFYHDLIDELLNAGIEPIPTLYHYDMPLALIEKYNGWIDRQSVVDFERYADFVIKEYASKVKYWTTINEQNIIVQYWDTKNIVDEKYLNNEQIKYQINHHLSLAHAIACKKVHDYVPNGMVGAPIDFTPIYPATTKGEDAVASANANALRNLYYLDVYFKGHYNEAAFIYLQKNSLAPVMLPGDEEIFKDGYSDFLAVNYYSSYCAKATQPGAKRRMSGVNLTGEKGAISGYEIQPDFYEIVRNDNLEATQWDWTIDPAGLEFSLRYIHDMYGVPMMITENGLGAPDILEDDGSVHDPYRIEFLTKHLAAIKRAIDYGVNMISYNAWTAIDLLSTSNGYKKRYGFVYVNRTDDDLKDLKRYKKDSFYWYQELIRTNGESL